MNSQIFYNSQYFSLFNSHCGESVLKFLEYLASYVFSLKHLWVTAFGVYLVSVFISYGTKEFAKLRALRAYVPYVSMRLTCLRAFVPQINTCLRAYVPLFFTCSRAYSHSQNILRLTSIPCIAVFLWIICRSSHRRCSLRKGVLRNFVKFTGKHLCQSLLFNKVAGLRPATSLKKKLWHMCFPINFAKFLRTPFLRNTSGRLLVYLTFHSIQYPKINPCF